MMRILISGAALVVLLANVGHCVEEGEKSALPDSAQVFPFSFGGQQQPSFPTLLTPSSALPQSQEQRPLRSAFGPSAQRFASYPFGPASGNSGGFGGPSGLGGPGGAGPGGNGAFGFGSLAQGSPGAYGSMSLGGGGGGGSPRGGQPPMGGGQMDAMNFGGPGGSGGSGAPPQGFFRAPGSFGGGGGGAGGGGPSGFGGPPSGFGGQQPGGFGGQQPGGFGGQQPGGLGGQQPGPNSGGGGGGGGGGGPQRNYPYAGVPQSPQGGMYANPRIPSSYQAYSGGMPGFGPRGDGSGIVF